MVLVVSLFEYVFVCGVVVCACVCVGGWLGVIVYKVWNFCVCEVCCVCVCGLSVCDCECARICVYVLCCVVVYVVCVCFCLCVSNCVFVSFVCV